MLSLWAERRAGTGQAQQVWKNTGLPGFCSTPGCPGLLGGNHFDLWTLLSDPVQTSGLNRARCGAA